MYVYIYHTDICIHIYIRVFIGGYIIYTFLSLSRSLWIVRTTRNIFEYFLSTVLRTVLPVSKGLKFIWRDQAGTD